MPAKENGVQSSTISYSNVVIPDGITKKKKKSVNFISFDGIAYPSYEK